MTLYQAAIHRRNQGRPPVWMMRQAGRYHSHYQQLKKKYSFIELCKNPEVACEVTLGPIREFDFDAAILFSDLLFPLEAMGMGLKYEEGPKLDWNLRDVSDLEKLRSGRDLVENLQFQSQALQLIRAQLPIEKSLLGFVGGPLTLYCYAVEGSHQGHLTSAREGFLDGRWEGFFEKLKDLLVENMLLQAQSGADAIAVLDTCAGEFDSDLYREQVVPMLRMVFENFTQRSSTPLIYYSKGTGPSHWESLKSLPISCLGIDWRHSLTETLRDWSETWAIQGNVDPHWLFLETSELEKRLRALFESVKNLPLRYRQAWVCGLGHGVLPKTPEANVHAFLRIQREIFSENNRGESQ